MKSHSIVVFVISALSLAKALELMSPDNKNVCDIKYNLHEQLADIVMNDQGAQVINLFRQNIQDICEDPLAHNAIIEIVDFIWDASENENIMKSLELLFTWTRNLIKNPNMQEIYRQNLEGLYYLADNEPLISLLAETLLYNVEDTVKNPHFDAAYEPVLKNVIKMMNIGKNVMFSTAAKAIPKSSTLKRGQNPQPQSPKNVPSKLQSPKPSPPKIISSKPQSKQQ